MEPETQLSAQAVADAFVRQYFLILKKSPSDIHKFYKDESVLARPDADGLMKSVTTTTGINDEILSYNFKDWTFDQDSVYGQDSIKGSVIVGVTGSMTDKDKKEKKFAQTFFLATQEDGGFYVHNDFFQFIKEMTKPSETSPPLAAAPSSPVAPLASAPGEDSSVKDQKDQRTSTKEVSDIGVKVADSSEGARPNKKSEQPVAQPAPNTQEDVKKASYASIVAKEGSSPPPPQSLPTSVVSSSTVKQSSASPAPPKSSAPLIKTSKPSSNGAFANGAPENVYDVKAVHIKGLPPKVNHESLLEVMKKFGTLKQKNIQIREYPEDGYRYAFVEFDNPLSARKAIEAGCISFPEWVCEIQHKRSANQGGYNYRGRSPSAKGGFRNDSFRGQDGERQRSGSWGAQDDYDRRGNYQKQGRGNYNNHQKAGSFQDRPRGSTYAVHSSSDQFQSQSNKE